jgi:hypothetical protein
VRGGVETRGGADAGACSRRGAGAALEENCFRPPR